MQTTIGQPESNSTSHRGRVLMLTHRLPYPPDRGDRIRSFQMLRFLISQGFSVSVACANDAPVPHQHIARLGAFAEQLTVDEIDPRMAKLRGAWSLATGGTVTLAYHRSDKLMRVIERWHNQGPFDAILTYCTSMLSYSRHLMAQSDIAHMPKHVLDLVDVDSLKWKSYAEKSSPPMSWLYALESRRLRKIETGKRDKIDAMLLTTQAELMAYRRFISPTATVQVVSNGVDLEYFQPQPDPENQNMIFVGVLDYRPNIEGLQWFTSQVLPGVIEKNPEAKLLIVGRDPAPAMYSISKLPGVELIGPVSDVREYIGKSCVSVAPLLTARGVQNKVLEAMASARPVVCTPSAAKGIDAKAGEEFIIAEQAQSWIEELNQLLKHPTMRGLIGTAARKRVEARYDWNVCMEPLVKLLGRD